jgi:SulP family sulfate permease
MSTGPNTADEHPRPLGLATPFEPVIAAARAYNGKRLRGDLVAGMTVAVIAIPQSMAYALIAGIPAVYGLYTAIIQGLIAFLFTSSSHLSTGPINTLSLLVGAAMIRLGVDDPDQRVQMVILLTLLVGLIQVACAAMRVGALVRYVSHEVIVGFTAGAGILIGVGQVPNFLGIDVAGAERTLPGVLGSLERVVGRLDQVSWASVGVGVSALAIVIIGRRISQFVPGPLLAVVGGAAAVAILGWTDATLPLVGELPRGLPTPALPVFNFTDFEALIGVALAVSLVGIVEAVSIGKAIAWRSGETIHPTREFLAQGAANFVSSFFQCMPGSGSFSRSALNYEAGARTRFAGVYASVFVAIVFLLFAPAARYIPLAALAAILFVIAYQLVDWRHIVRVARTSRDDTLVCLVTLTATLLIPLEFAIFLGVLLNIGAYVRKTSRLHVAQMVQTAGGPFVERPITDREGFPRVLFLQMEGDLFFGVADELRDRLTQMTRSSVRVVILRLKRTHSIDSTVLGVLDQFAEQMQARGGHVLLCGVRPELSERLRRYGLVGRIGEKNVFETGFGVFTSAKQALQRAKALLGSSLDTDHIGDLDETEGWAYEI